MISYNVHLNGAVQNDENGFKVGFDISIENGGNLTNIGEALQGTIDKLAEKAEKLPTENQE